MLLFYFNLFLEKDVVGAKTDLPVHVTTVIITGFLCQPSKV